MRSFIRGRSGRILVGRPATLALAAVALGLGIRGAHAQEAAPATPEDDVDLIEGVGGAFVFSERPARLAEWYSDVLGLEFEGNEEAGAFYQVFWFRDRERPDRPVDVHFAIMRSKVPLETDVPEEEPASMYGDQPFMVNLRVNDMDALVERLDSLDVEVLGRQDESYGSFIWIRDADGNRVELYESRLPPPGAADSTPSDDAGGGAGDGGEGGGR